MSISIFINNTNSYSLLDYTPRTPTISTVIVNNNHPKTENTLCRVTVAMWLAF